MADLADYINFSIQFDLTGETPVAVLTDTGDYPAGVPVNIKGNFIVIQPDGAQSGKMDFGDPDVKWDAVASILTPYNYTPRSACDGTLQNGTWKVKYTVRADGYEDTVAIKTFYLNFAKPVAAIEADFDVFTPELIYKDITDYTVPGFNDTVSRSWDVVAQDANRTITGSSQNIVLSYNSKFYDSRYQAALNSTVVYTWNSGSWLTVKIALSANGIAQANTPPSCKALMSQLLVFGDNDCGCHTDKEYLAASILLQAINNAMADQQYDGLYKRIVDYENIVSGQKYQYINTGAEIKPYQYNCGSVNVINSEVSAVVGVEVLDFAIGDTGYPQAGDTVLISDKLYNKNIDYFSIGNVFQSEKAGQFTYNRDIGNKQGKITVAVPFYDGTRVLISTSAVSTSTGGGTDGQTSYVHFKYSNDGGATFTANNGDTPGAYMGTYTDFEEAASANVSDYKWAKLEGPQGEQGSQGEQGPQGEQGVQGDPGPAAAFRADSLSDL